MFNKQAQFCIKMEEAKVEKTTEWTCQYGEKVKSFSVFLKSCSQFLKFITF